MFGTFEDSLVEVCFVVDCSSSMGHNLEKIQPQLQDLTKWLCFETCKKRTEVRFRVGCVFFRDHDNKQKRLEGFNFTEDLEYFAERLASVETVGGNDMPEDLLGGLNMSLSYDWKGQNSFIVLIGDAPCHGTKYHSLDDCFPEGDPLGLTPEGVLGKMKAKGIQLVFVKLSNDTNKMVEIFKGIYDDKSKLLDMQVHDCRKEAKTQVKEKLMVGIGAKLKLPYSLAFLCTRVIKKQDQWREQIACLPLELQDYVITTNCDSETASVTSAAASSTKLY